HTRWPRDWSSDVCSSDLVMSRASKKKEEGMDIFPWGLAGGAIALAVFAFLVSQMVFTIHTKQAAVIEKFGKFERLAGPGLNFKEIGRASCRERGRVAVVG